MAYVYAACSLVPKNLSPRLRDKIWEWPGDEAMQHVQYVLLFLVLVVNSNQFTELYALTQAACSYALLTDFSKHPLSWYYQPHSQATPRFILQLKLGAKLSFRLRDKILEWPGTRLWYTIRLDVKDGVRRPVLYCYHSNINTLFLGNVTQSKSSLTD